MTVRVLRRMVLVGLSAATLFGMGVSTSVQGQRDIGRQEDKQEDKGDAKQDKRGGNEGNRGARQGDRERRVPPGHEKKAELLSDADAL